MNEMNIVHGVHELGIVSLCIGSVPPLLLAQVLIPCLASGDWSKPPHTTAAAGTVVSERVTAICISARYSE